MKGTTVSLVLLMLAACNKKDTSTDTAVTSMGAEADVSGLWRGACDVTWSGGAPEQVQLEVELAYAGSGVSGSARWIHESGPATTYAVSGEANGALFLELSAAGGAPLVVHLDVAEDGLFGAVEAVPSTLGGSVDVTWPCELAR